IYNMQGQNVGRFNTNEIDMGVLPSGMYILVVKDIEGNINIAKVALEH
ncbi:MAG: T9SS type A sorting domain-containing protein, partial [Bacteroidaceae bacterium]|nr:T9SS type A sorting domain-containing protein [Bacteroidaceae bacterium]